MESYPSQTHTNMTNEILSSPNSSFETQCRELHETHGANCREMVEAFAGRLRTEWKQIRATYKSMYGQDLHQVFHQKRYEAPALYLCMLDSHLRDAIIVREALERREVDFKALVEIFVGRKSGHIGLMRQAYQERFRGMVDQDIINIEPPHSYQKILVALAASHKAHYADVSQHIAKRDAMRLHENGGGNGGAVEEPFIIEIFSKRSIPQLKLTFSCYNRIYGRDYVTSLERETSKEFEDALKMVVKCMCDPPTYYTQALYRSIKGRKVDKAMVGRILVSRAQIDMEKIQSSLKKKYGIELKDAICEIQPAGDYRDFLLALASKPSTCF